MDDGTQPDRSKAMPQQHRDRKPRVLFVAEAVTLAHVARPAVLAATLDRSSYDVFFATDPRYKHLFPELADLHHDLWSISSKDFLNSLAKGQPLYTRQILERYILDDLSLIDSIEPDLIIGDFRLSLSVSARLRNIPYAAISNTYWTVGSNNRYSVPQLPMTKLLGVTLSQYLFTWSRPLAFALHCIPLNSVRKKYGMASLGHDLRKIYSDADQVLLADMAEYFPVMDTAKNHHYIGPLPWSPRDQAPPWWDNIDRAKPIVYVSLGSSGQIDLLPTVLDALAALPVTVIAATAGRTTLSSVPSNAHVSEFIPGDKAADMASLVICNGGSLTTYQAIHGGTPVLGIASNLDQHLNMSYLSAAGIGEVLRTEKASLNEIRELATRLLNQAHYKTAALKAQQAARGYNVQARLTSLVKDMLRGEPPQTQYN